MALIMRNKVAEVAFTTMTANTDTAFAWNDSDDYTLIVVTATADDTLTVKAGDGLQGVNDLSLTIPTGTSVIKLESGRFKNVTGTNKGKIVLSCGKATTKIGVVAVQ